MHACQWLQRSMFFFQHFSKYINTCQNEMHGNLFGQQLNVLFLLTNEKREEEEEKSGQLTTI